MMSPQESSRSGADARHRHDPPAGLAHGMRYPAVVGVVLVAVAAPVGLVVSRSFTSNDKADTLASVSVRVPAAAKASVFATTGNSTHGDSGTLRIDRSPVVRSYVRFDSSRLTGHLTSARLALEPLSAGTATTLRAVL